MSRPSFGEHEEKEIRRENRFKNVVMRIIINIRERKKRPKLSDFLKVYKEKKDQPNAKRDFRYRTRNFAEGPGLDGFGIPNVWC